MKNLNDYVKPLVKNSDGKNPSKRVTSVLIDIKIYEKLKKENINLSKLMNDFLTEFFKDIP